MKKLIVLFLLLFLFSCSDTKPHISIYEGLSYLSFDNITILDSAPLGDDWLHFKSKKGTIEIYMKYLEVEE